MTKMPRCSICWRSIEYDCRLGLFHSHFRVQVILIVEDLTVTVKWRTAIKVLLLYFNLCLGVKLDTLSYSFTSISFFTMYVVIVNCWLDINSSQLHGKGNLRTEINVKPDRLNLFCWGRFFSLCFENWFQKLYLDISWIAY